MLDKPILSACMIVRNEEGNIHRCLSSFAHLVDEIIVVDTGSTDNTIQICKDFGAKVYEHPWENNFSLHRNQSISYATNEWVFIIDADEEIVLPNTEENPDCLKDYLRGLTENINAVMCEFCDIQKEIVAMRFNTSRLFRRKNIHYEGIVHNMPILEGSKDGEFCTSFYINHYGYDLEGDAELAKEKRTMGLLEARLKSNPEDYEVYFYLAQIHSTRERYKEAVECGEIYLNNKENLGAYFNRSIYYSIFQSYMKLEDVNNAERWLKKGIQELPDDLDIALAEVEYGLVMNNFMQLFSGGRRYMTIYEKLQKDPTIIGNRFMFTNNYLALSYVLFHVGTQQIIDGLKVLDILKDTLIQCPERYMNGMLKDVQKFFDTVGMNINVKLQENKDENIADMLARVSA